MAETLERPPEGRRDDSGRRPWTLIALLGLAGVAAVAGGGAAIAVELGRKPTAKQIEAAGREELASRWRALPAGEIFPAQVMAAPDPAGRKAGPVAFRVGIAPAVPCAAGVDRPVADVLTKFGCRRILRATYTDATRALTATLGIAVMSDSSRVSSAESALGSIGGAGDKARVGVRTAPFPGTVAASFADPLRQEFAVNTNGTRYLFFRAAGWAIDHGDRVGTVPAGTFAFAQTALDQVVLRFTDSTEPCERWDVRC
ncbi:hypothetical protein [Actinomadura roseirufa]|uniref:hypothetical protein n=1 Tax=Actinomadura roseirufa TaxID=2094049 RepID=UPI0010416C20|nr:hypothetical protein [Actinomadura roseirufa]